VAKRFVKVALESDVPEGEVRVFEAGENQIAVARVSGVFYAVEDVCTHDDGPLGEGLLEGCEIECPRHGARFDLRTGAATRMPAVAPIGTFPVRNENGAILVELEME
jgi:3-phenylpropionate/trans-cinnamate dioxygenase ferredoxin component